MQTFNFPFHGNPAMTVDDNSSSIELKSGFRFSAEPSEPMLRLFTLTFPVLGYEFLPDETADSAGTVNPEHNVIALWEFYKAHGTWKTFIYPHPFFGNVTVKFDTPFTIPQVQGNLGKVTNIEVKFREHPA